MEILYTKQGRPLQRSGGQLWAKSGKYLGTIQGQYVFDTTGRYSGTIENDRVVYRSIDAANLGSPSVAAPAMPIAEINALPAPNLGDEPPFAD